MIRIYLRPSGLHRHVATMLSILSLMEMAEVEPAIGAENLLRKGLVDDRAGQHRRNGRARADH